MGFEFKPATRQGFAPFTAIYGESGCGKTYTSLLLARGIAGPAGRIAMIDTESGRGAVYADVIPGGYDHCVLPEPFSPSRYIQAIEAAERLPGLKAMVLDSGSHEWEGSGSVQDMASKNEESSGKMGLHNWRKPKQEHQLFVLKLLRLKVPLIVCLRAKYKTRQIKENGRTVIVKDDYTSPVQAEDFIYESTVHMEIMPNHHARITKVNHPDLRACFPKDGPIEIKHGELLAQWCANAGGSKPAGKTRDQLAKEFFELTKPQHKGDKIALGQFCVDELLIPETKLLADCTADELQAAITKYKAKFA